MTGHHRPGPPPDMFREVAEDLVATLRARSTVAVVAADGRTHTGVQLAAHIDRATTVIAGRVGPGGRCLFSVPPSVGSLVAAIATARIGATIVFADPSMSSQRLASIAAAGPADQTVALAHPALWLGAAAPGLARHAGLHTRMWRDLPRAVARMAMVGPRVVAPPRGLGRGTSSFAHAPPASASAGTAPDVGGALWIPTSGTTGAPKVVVHSQSSLAAVLDAVADVAEQAAPGAVSGTVCTDQLHLVVATLRAGGTVALHADDDDAHQRALRSSAAGATFATPTRLLRWTRAARAAGMTAVPATCRLVVTGSAPLSSQAARDVRAVLAPTTRGCSIHALSEATPVAHVSFAAKAADHGRGDLVGLPHPDLDLRFVQREVHVSGPQVAPAHLVGLRRVDHVDGWLPTGDLGFRDDDGNLRLLGRAKDMILRDGTNLYPSLYEPAVAALPEVAAAHWVGVATVAGDTTGAPVDERVVVLVVPAAGVPAGRATDRVLRALAAGLVEADAVPDHVAAIAATPVAGRSDKPDRARLRALARSALGEPTRAGPGLDPT